MFTNTSEKEISLFLKLYECEIFFRNMRNLGFLKLNLNLLKKSYAEIFASYQLNYCTDRNFGSWYIKNRHNWMSERTEEKILF
jgi:hypothetical protein